MSVARTRIRIHDTRRIAQEQEIELTGLPRSLYLACDIAPPVERVMSIFVARGFAKSEVERAAQDLLGRKLMLSVNDHLIALATREPLAGMPGLSDYPGGGLVSSAARARIEKRDSERVPQEA